jgi:hypothetical protein
LTDEEHVVLLLYCRGHAVAMCDRCGGSFRQEELGSELLGYSPHVCPNCHRGLGESVRAHLHDCGTLPPEVRRQVQEVQDAALRLIKHSQELVDRTGVLKAEMQAHLAIGRALLQANRAALADLRRALRHAAPSGR